MTIRDIARLARVSTSTVSRVINNENVGKKTRQKVLRVIQRYEYYPNTYAQYLGRRNNAKIITNSGTVSRKT
ncbi:MAG: LacI family DNA-binding transcriptional regulator [Candidatus Omnitrophota bacterium]